jgi:alkylation response protein AidB-like acyl-CoA dehydrogenase
MDFVFTPEHEALRAATRDLLARHSPEQAVRAAMEADSGYDPELWRRMTEVGLQGLAVPEEFGGAGGGIVELAVVMEEMGRALYCGPFLSSAVMAATALAAVDDPVARKYLPDICGGSLLATVADVGLLAGDGQSPAVVADGDRTARLDGRVGYVPDGHIADLLAVTALDEGRHGLYLVDRRSAGVTATLLPTMDLTRKMAAVEFSGAEAQRLGTPEDAGPVLARVRHLAAIALAAEQAGGAQRMMELAVAYAKTRVQFGRTIGSFQAVKHRCAEMAVDVEAARSAAYHAIATAADEPGGNALAIAASIAHSYCSEAFTRVTADCIQVHGGIGFTWEHSAHLYYRRAKSSELLFGSPATHRRALAALLLLASLRARPGLLPGFVLVHPGLPLQAEDTLPDNGALDVVGAASDRHGRRGQELGIPRSIAQQAIETQRVLDQLGPLLEHGRRPQLPRGSLGAWLVAALDARRRARLHHPDDALVNVHPHRAVTEDLVAQRSARRQLGQPLGRVGDRGRDASVVLQAGALVRQDCHSDAPAIPDRPDPVGVADPDVFEEHLAEVLVTVHLPQRPDRDPGSVHPDGEHRQALVLGHGRIRPRQQEPPGRVRGPARPDLLAGQQPASVVATGPGRDVGEIRAGGGLGKHLAPDLRAVGDRAQPAALLLLRAVHE